MRSVIHFTKLYLHLYSHFILLLYFCFHRHVVIELVSATINSIITNEPWAIRNVSRAHHASEIQ